MTWTQTYISWRPCVLSVLRIMPGLLFLQYGLAKLLKFPAVPAFKDGDAVFATRPCRNARARGRRSDDLGPVHPSRGIRSRRGDGVCLFSRTFAARLPAHSQRRHSRSCSASCSFTSPSPAPVRGASMRCAKSGNSRSAAKHCRIDLEPSVAENIAPQRPEPWHSNRLRAEL